MVKLDSICRPKQWKTIAASQLLDDGYVVYGANGKIGYYSEYTHENPTVMITCRGATCGNVHISEPKAYINGNAMALDDVDPERVDINYLRYCLIDRGFRDVISGSAQPQITGKGLSKVQIPLPPLETQKQIAEVLEKADQLRKDCQQMEQELNSLAQSVFIDMFGDPVTNPKGWDLKPLSSLGEVKGGLQVTSKRAANPISVPYLRVANVYRDHLELDEVKEIRVTENELERVLLEKGDVLFVEGHGNANEVGRTAVWNDEVAQCVHQNHLIRFRPGADVRPEYVSAFVNSASGKRQLLKMSKTTSGLNTLSTSNIKSIQVLVPPLLEQDDFLAFLASCKAQQVVNDQLSVELDQNFNALMQKAFKGELNL
ncbi:restriction endonuclease subunit S [Vibrio alginolyticus]|nr:restriction endonuclease subunit S [Vibrio alginolyticus]EEZ82890.1 hypothetical protein VMC_22760 [Vibrio alginolyticus 40B]MCG6331355.1 restriction endonuclease subunit S [Vibrio alginolyticus]